MNNVIPRRRSNPASVILLLAMPLFGGCVLKLGASNDQGAAGGDTTNPPPGGSGGEGALTDAQQARKDEADRYVAQVIYKGATVTQSLQLASGDVVDGRFSLIEFTVGCPAINPTEMIGVVISVDKANVGGRNQQGVYDGLPRLHVEYANSKSGQMKYIWDTLDGAFRVYNASVVRPGQIVPVSVLGGAQVEHLLTIFQVPTGDWWIAYGLNLLGYYPASLFTMLNGGACESRWYAEVYNPAPKAPDGTGQAVKTEMGSGKFAAVGRPNVAYVRNPKYYDPAWFSVEPKDLIFAKPVEESCYTRSKVDPDPVSGDSFLPLGGPGGKDPGCKWPFP